MAYAGLTEEFSNYDKSEIVILPVPYDETSTWLKGTSKGPGAIIEASCNMELYDIETDSDHSDVEFKVLVDDDTKLLVAHGKDGLQLFDIKDKTKPKMIGSKNLNGNTSGLSLLKKDGVI